MADTNDSTRTYYEKNAETYALQTIGTDMSHSYELFLQYVPEDGRILDIGCGSGRDLRYFREKGYSAEGLELSRSLAALAREYSECTVYEGDARNWMPADGNRYDAIWACASLLHLTIEEFKIVLHRLPDFLKSDGVIFCSMKLRASSGYDENGRYFCEFNQKILNQIVDNIPTLELHEYWEDRDGLQRQNVSWISFILHNRSEDAH